MSAYHRPLDENDLTLVERVKMTPSLYDPRNPNFRFAHRKSQDWEKLASNLGLSSTYAKRRWTSLRDRYSRELKAMREHPERKGYGKDEFFRIMDFLRCFVRKRDRRRNVTVKNDEAYWETGSNDASNKVFSSKLLDAHCAQNDEKEDEQEANNLDFDDNTTAIHHFENKLNLAEETVEFPDYMPGHRAGGYEIIDEQSATDTVSNRSSANNKSNVAVIRSVKSAIASPTQTVKELQQSHPNVNEPSNTETGDDFFCKSIAAYLRQLSRRHKIKAKVEMFQILEKYIEIEENELAEKANE